MGEYECWNQVILEVVFPEIDSPEPVYMDFEDEVLDEARRQNGYSCLAS